MIASYANKLALAMTIVGTATGLMVASFAWQTHQTGTREQRHAQMLALASSAAAGFGEADMLALGRGEAAGLAATRARLAGLLESGSSSGLAIDAACVVGSAPGKAAGSELDLLAHAGPRASSAEAMRGRLKQGETRLLTRAQLADGPACAVDSVGPGGAAIHTAAAAIVDSIGTRIGWLALQAPEAELLADTAPLARVLAVTALGVVPVSILLGVGLSSLATRPLREILAGAQRLARGDLKVKLKARTDDELGALANAVNGTASLLQSLNLAKQVQQQLLPRNPPKIDGLDISAVCVYSDQTGGDYFDFLPLGENGKDGWAVIVADVTGHGVPAALLMATARSILRSEKLALESLGEFLGKVNKELCRQIPEGRFMTMYVLLLESGLRTIRWGSAGHDAAILYDPGRNTFRELEGRDLPLGVDPTASFSAEMDTLHPGDGHILVIGTDGIWEAQDAENRMFGKEGLRRVLRKAANEPAEAIGKQLLQSVEKFRGDRAQTDDITFIVIKLGGSDLLLPRPAPGYVP